MTFEEGVDLPYSVPVVSFCLQVKSSLLCIPNFLAVHILNWDAGSKDGSGVIGISFVWPDTASSLSPSSHFEQLAVMRALLSQLFGVAQLVDTRGSPTESLAQNVSTHEV